MPYSMFTLELVTENAAFGNYDETICECEVARILQCVAIKIRSGDHSGGGVCVDANGNRVGRWDFDAKNQLAALLVEILELPDVSYPLGDDLVERIKAALALPENWRPDRRNPAG